MIFSTIEEKFAKEMKNVFKNKIIGDVRKGLTVSIREVRDKNINLKDKSK